MRIAYGSSEASHFVPTRLVRTRSSDLFQINSIKSLGESKEKILDGDKFDCTTVPKKCPCKHCVILRSDEGNYGSRFTEFVDSNGVEFLG